MTARRPLMIRRRFDLRRSYSPGEHIRIVRVREGLLELDQLGVGERGAVPALLPARIMIQTGQLVARAAVVLGEVAVLALVVI